MFSDLVAAGFGWIRIQLQWVNIEVTQNVYTWNTLDDFVTKANAAGLNCSYVLQGPAPSFYSSGQLVNNLDTLTPITVTYADPAKLAIFAAAVVTRYNGLNGHGSIQAIEIGNEEYDSLPAGSNGQNSRASLWRDPRYYVQTLPIVGAAIRAVTSYTGKIGTCAVWWDALPHMGDFVTAIYAASGNLKQYFDYLNFHWYPSESGSGGNTDVMSWNFVGGSQSTCPSFLTAWQAIQAIVQANDPGKEIWVTEVSWYGSHNWIGAGSQRATNAFINYDEQQRNFYLMMESARLSGAMAKFFVYTTDYAPFSTTPASSANQDENVHRISDAYSIVQQYQDFTNSNAQTTFYTPAWYAIKNYATRYPTWTVQKTATIAASAYPAILAVDSFLTQPNQAGKVRANSASAFGPASDQTAGSGSNWIQVGSGTGIQSLQNSEGGIASSGIHMDIYRHAATSALNQELQMRVATANTSDTVGLIGRLAGTTSSNITGYTLTLVGNTLSINKLVNGTSTPLSSTSITRTNGTFYRLRFRMYDSGGVCTLKARFWAEGVVSSINNILFYTKKASGSSVTLPTTSNTISNTTSIEPNNWTFSTTDSSPLSAGGVGFLANATTSTPVNFDSFMAIDQTNMGTRYNQTVAVTNNNAASITFTIASDSTWLTATSTTLTIPAASNQNVTVTADTTTLSSGVYSGNITITPSLGSATIIPVSITVL